MSHRPRARSCLLLAFVLAACAHYPVNTRASEYRKDGGYRFDPLVEKDRADELFICLSLSGGGTRAAALAYGVLQALRDARIPRRGAETALLEEVDCISSVSGGSFTTAYYALFGARLFEDSSVDTLDLMGKLAQEREKAQLDMAACQRYLDQNCPAAPPLPQFARPIRTCIIEVTFEALQPAGRRDEFLRLPTSFALPDDKVDALVQVGRELLSQSADFQRLLRALRGEPELGAGIEGEKGNCS